jgi:CSN8/PSMD8/EIF3K family
MRIQCRSGSETLKITGFFNLQLVAAAYSTIRLSDLALYLGLSETDASEMASRAGWTYDMHTGMILHRFIDQRGLASRAGWTFDMHSLVFYRYLTQIPVTVKKIKTKQTIPVPVYKIFQDWISCVRSLYVFETFFGKRKLISIESRFSSS